MLTRIAELDLMELPIEDRAFGEDPDPWFSKARARHPFLAKYAHGYLVHGHREIRDLIQMDDKLHLAVDDVVEIMGATGTPWGDFMKNLLIAKMGDEHRRMRDALKPFFKPRQIAGHLGLIREVVDTLLNEWAPRCEFDFTEFASNFPVAVMFGLIGADIDELPRIKWALETQGLSYSLDKSLLPDMVAAHAIMMQFTAELIEKRRASGEKHDDLLTALIAAIDGGVLSDLEAREQLYFLFAAGYDTTKNQLSMTTYLLLQHPDLWERCASDREFCTLAIEEGLRHTSPSSPPRVVLNDIEYEGLLIPKGSHLMFLLNISGRDPRSFAEPMEYRPGREYARHHLAFGKGAHICLGLHLARFQMEEGLHRIAQRLRSPVQAGDVRWRRFPGVWGLETLPIRFMPA